MQNVPNQPKQKKFKLSPNAVMTYLLVAVLVTMGVSFSKYSTTSGNSDVARVAKFDPKISVDITSLIVNNRNVYEDINALFITVSNYDIDTNEMNTEVTFSYEILKIELKDKLQEGVSLELYKYDEATEDYTEIVPCEVKNYTEYFFTVNDSLAVGSPTGYNDYMLYVVLDETVPHAKQILENITVSVDAVQVD